MARKSPADILAQIRKIIEAWQDLAPDTVLYGYTLEQFREVVRPSLEARIEIDDLQRRIRMAIKRRNSADPRATRVMRGIVDGVKGTPDHGEDSALYAAMGYVMKSARRKRRRKKK